MNKKSKQKTKKDDSKITLGDLLNQELVDHLKNKKQELKATEEKRKQEEEQKKREELRLKEKNKTFEELLNESKINWREFKD